MKIDLPKIIEAFRGLMMCLMMPAFLLAGATSCSDELEDGIQPDILEEVSTNGNNGDGWRYSTLGD